MCHLSHQILTFKDAPKWKFLAEAEQIETLGRRAEYQMRFFMFFPHLGLFCHFFSLLHKLNNQNVLFTVLSCFSNKNIYLTLNIF